MKVLATYSLKGGVGKTAVAVSVAHLAAAGGAPTLMWDLDPQGAATFSLRVKPKVKGGAKALVTGKRDLDAVVKGTDTPALDLVPADFSYRYMDLELDAVSKSTRRIRRALREVDGDYEWAIIDGPPGISLVSEAIVAAADALLVPVVPTTLSLRMLEQLDTLVAGAGRKRLQVLPFFSMVDRRRKLHRELVETLPAAHPAMLRTVIPASADIERISQRRAPVAAFAPRSAAAKALTALWAEVQQRLGAAAPSGG